MTASRPAFVALLLGLALVGCGTPSYAVQHVPPPRTLACVNAGLVRETVRLQLRSGGIYPRAVNVEVAQDVTLFRPDAGHTGPRHSVPTSDVRRIFLPAERRGSTAAMTVGAVLGFVLGVIALTSQRDATGTAEGFIEEGARVVLVIGAIGLAVLGAAIGNAVVADQASSRPTVLFDGSVGAYPVVPDAECEPRRRGRS